jgi:uncharacterized protein
MSIDCHTYIGHWPFRQLRGNTPQGLISYMDRFGIERSMVANLDGVFYRNPQPANEDLSAAIKQFRGKFIPFAVINPSYPDWEHDLEVCHTRFEKLLEAAHARDMPVAFTRWPGDPRQRSWMEVARVGRCGPSGGTQPLAHSCC